MDAILLCMKKNGIRFFSKIKFENTDVMRFYGRNNFLDLLNRRRKEFDNILLIAHGANKAIITPTGNLNHPYTTYISLEETNVFSNDFVFAVACSTANEFGKRCVKEGAIAYLGYQIEIGCLFSSYTTQISNLPKRVSDAIDIIIKRIFVEELSRSYEKFLREPINVQMLKETFSYLVERRISKLVEMNIDEIFQTYNVKITERHYEKYFVGIVISMLTYLDEVSKHLVCVGDSNYISSSFIMYRKEKGVDVSEILTELDNNKFFLAIKNEKYKSHLKKIACLN